MIKGILYQMCKNKQQQRLSLQQTHSRVQQLDTSQTHQKTKTSFTSGLLHKVMPSS